ncbi:hypothetical protein [Xenorhabdus thuongxuanensis]|uniref:Cysteine dioxygenase n=1 Tax=Xenorhabdus thuongxuanensis TaxID=1873484 RepID=A0A1Q5TRG7_9GAMM|nr:hypothetical protein [Xenorhabdus thuongxuanensis]OKP02824.1 hypothetical protein Xentx_03100 [Xenorhabdus thuongxuanensis]
MNIIDFAKRINYEITSAQSMFDMINNIRNIMSVAITDELFLNDCINELIENIKNTININEIKPLYVDHNNKWRMNIFLWNPKSENQPHQHNTWSVSGVMHNKIKIKIYKKTNEELSVIDELIAIEGKTGYLIPPCIHALGNPDLSEYSITLHVFCDSELRKDKNGDTIWLGKNDPRDNIDHSIVVLRNLTSCLLLTDKLSPNFKFNILEKIFPLGTPSIKLQSYKKMIRLDISKAEKYSSQLESVLSGDILIRVKEINAKLHGRRM